MRIFQGDSVLNPKEYAPGCKRCKWNIKKLKSKVDSTGTILRVEILMPLVDAFGEIQNGLAGKYGSIDVDMERKDGRWKALLLCPSMEAWVPVFMDGEEVNIQDDD